MKTDINEAVQLVEAIPDECLKKGDIGVVVAVFSEPNEAYEVEFSDSDGVPIAQLPLLPHQFVVLRG